jgi:transposase
MEHYAGLDVSIKETSVCVIDGTGRVVREVKVPTEPEAILAVLSDEDFNIKRIGLEAGPLSQWLYGELTHIRPLDQGGGALTSRALQNGMLRRGSYVT